MRGGFIGIGGWLKHSFIDFPGVVSTVLFYSGCNLRCPYCHNPSLAAGPPDEPVDPGAIRDYLHRRQGIIEGVVLSGGEPTIHRSLPATVRESRALGYRVKLDTNGLLPEVIRQAAPDYLALDIKTTPERYRTILGAAMPDVQERLTRSISLVKSMGERAEIRITASRKLLDWTVVNELAVLLAGVHRIFLQPIRQRYPLLDPAYNHIPPLSQETLQGFAARLGKAARFCAIRSDDGRARAALWKTTA